jgi:beta-glucosidase/6-phospho-beta-glucosidase/beta-galactosidase
VHGRLFGHVGRRADVALIKDLGMDTYQFSVSWSRF